MDAKQLVERYQAGERSFLDAQLRGSNLQNVDLPGALLDRAQLADAKLVAADLEGARLVGADLVGADLRDVNFSAADLQNANLRAALLQHADLRGADFRDVNFQHADLRNANLQHADLRGADLRHADLREADLRHALLEGCQLLGATIDAGTLRISEWTPDQLSEVIGLGAELLHIQGLSGEMRRVVTGENRGLTLYFDASLNALDVLLLHAAVVAILGADTDCRMVELAQTQAGSLIRFGGPDCALRTLADALAARVWQNKVHEQGHVQIPTADVLPRGDRMALSVLIDRSNRYELYTADSADSRPVLDQTWHLDLSPAQRLSTVLVAVLGSADLRLWIHRDAGARHLLTGLPGPEASARVFALAAVESLAARDLVDRDFFEHLLAERPERRREIAFVAGIWGFELPVDQATAKY